MAKKKKYKVYKKGGESFKPHMMYNPKTNEGYLANTYDDHLRMNDMGYGHEPMMGMGGMPCYECGGHIYQDGGIIYNTPEYNQAYQQGAVTRYNPATDTYQAPDLPEFTVKPAMSFMDEMDYIGNTAMNFLGELSAVNPAIRIMNDPMGTLKGTGQTVADLAMYSNPGSAMYAQFSDRNPMTGQPYWEGVDQAMDVLSVSPAISIAGKTAKLAKPAMKGLKSTMKKGLRKLDPYSRIDDLVEETRKEGLDWYRELAAEEAEKVAKFKRGVDQEITKATIGRQPLLNRKNFALTDADIHNFDELNMRYNIGADPDFFYFDARPNVGGGMMYKGQPVKGVNMLKEGQKEAAMKGVKYSDIDWHDPAVIEQLNIKTPYRGIQAFNELYPNKYGGTMKYEFGGSSTAPQNINTGDIGRTNIDLMKNHWAQNTVKNILQQRDELVAQMTEQMYQFGGDPRLKENPNRAFGAMAAQNYYGAQNKAMESGKNFWNSVQDFAQNYQTPRPYQPPMQKVESKKADLSGAYTPTQPQLAIPQGGYKGAADYMAYGGDLPMAQYGKNINPNIPIPSKEQRERMLGLNYDIIPSADQKNAFLRKKYKRENPNMPFFGEMEGSKDPSTGYWDRVVNEWSKPWGSGGWEESGMYIDPRATQAIKDLIPFVDRDVSPVDYLTNAALFPQKGINQLLTGYFELPSTTAERYHGDLGGWGVALDIVTDPFITAGLARQGLVKGLPFVGRGFNAAYEYAKPYAKKAITEAVKLAKNVPEASKKAFIYAVERGEDLYELYKKNPKIQKVIDEGVSKLPQIILHTRHDDPSQEAYKKKLMREEILRELGQPQQAAASSTAVAPRGPVPTVNPNQNQFGNLSDEDLKRLTGAYAYGGSLPKAKNGKAIPASIRNPAIDQELARREMVRKWTNPLYPYYTPVSEPSIPDYTQKYNRYNAVTGEPYNVDEEETVTGSSAKAGAKAGKQAKQTGKSSTPSTAAEVAEEQANKGADSKTTTRTGNTDEISEGPTTTDTKTDTTTTGNVRTVGDSYGYYGYPGGRFKLKGSIKEYDPLTGKMTKKTRIQPLKYDTAYGPQNVFGRRGPRVVKIPINQTYNINPFKMDLTPGSENFNRLYNTSGSSTAVQDDYNPAEEQAYYDNMMNDYYNAYMQDQSWQKGDYPQPGSFRKRSEEMPPVTADQVDWRYKGMQDDGIGPSRKEWRESKRRDRLKDRERRGMFNLLNKADRDFPNEPATHDYEFEIGGQKPFSLDSYQPGQFTQGFGPQEGGFGSMQKGFNLWETGESPYMSTFKETDLEGKWKQQGLGQGWSMLGPGLTFLGDALNARQVENPDWAYTASATAPRIMSNDADRGSWTANAGFFRPDQQTPVQFGKYGGQMYQDGGEYELTDQEIQAIISAGGEVEFL